MAISEVLGIAGTSLIVLGFCFKKVNTIRILNMIGSVLFVVYGILIGATYTWAANALLFLINFRYLITPRLRDPD